MKTTKQERNLHSKTLRGVALLAAAFACAVIVFLLICYCLTATWPL